MTDFAASPRTRSSRSSPARRRPRAAAASGPGQSRAAARPGRDAAAGDASRDEHTLDLFGTAFEENARTDEAAAGVAVDETAHDAARVQARGFGGLDRRGAVLVLVPVLVPVLMPMPMPMPMHAARARRRTRLSPRANRRIC